MSIDSLHQIRSVVDKLNHSGLSVLSNLVKSKMAIKLISYKNIKINK